MVERGDTVFRPAQVEAQLYVRNAGGLGIGQYKNHVLQAHQRRAREAEKKRHAAIRQQKKDAAARAAQTRGNPDIRGLRLGMTLAEVRALFADQVVEWQPKWKPDRKFQPYSSFDQVIRLADGSKIAATFTSPQNGSVLFVFVYEQYLKNGPSIDKLSADLKAKYGAPDRIRGGYWYYKLVSRAEKETLGALMQFDIRAEGKSRQVSYLRMLINDAGFGDFDKRAAYAARQEAKRREFEAGKSGAVKF